MKKHWSIERVVWTLNLLLLATMLAGAWVIILVIQDGRQFNLKNLEQNKLLSAQVDHLLEEDIPLARLLVRQLETIQQVKNEITLYVLGEVRDSTPLKNALGKLTVQLDKVERAWPEQIEREALKDLRGNVGIMEGIAEELYVTSSPVQLEELAENTQSAAQDMVRANARVNQIIDQHSALSEKVVLDANRRAIQSGEQTRKILSTLVLETIAVLALLVLASIMIVVANILFWNRSLKREVVQKTTALEKLAETQRIREQAEEELLRSERLAAIGQVTATVSHELRNPLGAVRNSLNVIKKLVGGEDSRLPRALELAGSGVTRCEGIINDLLDFTRDPKLEPRPTLIDDWLERTLGELTIPEGITLSREFASGAEIAVDQDRIRRTIINVVDNASQAITASDGEAGHNGNLTVATRLHGERLEVVVSDTGAGIPEEEMEKVFDPFFTTKSFGVGLGLPTVKRIMEQHGGGIEVSSEVGSGTQVVLWFPYESEEKGTRK